MPATHPVHFNVEVFRHNFVMHAQLVDTREEAEALRAKFEEVPHAEVVITPVHDAAESDLTTHTRELLDNI